MEREMQKLTETIIKLQINITSIKKTNFKLQKLLDEKK